METMDHVLKEHYLYRWWIYNTAVCFDDRVSWRVAWEERSCFKVEKMGYTKTMFVNEKCNRQQTGQNLESAAFDIFHTLLTTYRGSTVSTQKNKEHRWQHRTGWNPKGSPARIKILREHQREKWKENGSLNLHCDKDIMSGKQPALSTYLSNILGGCVIFLAAYCLFESVISQTWQVTWASDFNAWKYKQGVKKVSAPACLLSFWTYFLGTVEEDRCDLTSRQTMKAGELRVWTRELTK